MMSLIDLTVFSVVCNGNMLFDSDLFSEDDCANYKWISFNRQYEFQGGSLLRINTSYGYYTPRNAAFTPYLRDYQGNNRNSASYYAYGLPVQDSNVSDQDPYLYGGKEFYSLKGINIYDFNARTYAPDIARFMQPDPKAHDYHWLSPYAYCGGDPINYIDPTSQVLTTVCNGITYTWSFNAEYGWGFYDQDGQLYDGDSSFITELTKSLKYLMEGIKGNELINSLVSRSKVVLLKDNNESGSYYDPKTHTIYMDYSTEAEAPLTNGTFSNQHVVLAHELVHSILPNNQMGKWETINTVAGQQEVTNSEKYTTHWENMIRAEHCLPLRTHYGWDASGKKVLQLIDEKTRTRLYYEFPIFPGNRTIPYHYFRYLKK